MPIDANIPLQAKQYQLQDPTEVMGRVMNLRNLAGQQQLQQLSIDQAQRNQSQEQTLADLYQGNINPDGTVNRQAVLSGAAQRGLGARIPGMQKQFAEADKATADVGHVGAQTDKLKWETAKSKIDVSGAALSSLLSNPSTTHDDVIRTMVSLVQQGIVSPDQGQQAIRELPGDPVRLRQYLVQKGMEVMDASKRMEMAAPKFDKINNGKTTSFVDTNPYTNPTGPAPIQMTTTPGEDQSAATTRRGQNMTDSRAREGNDIARQAARTQLVETPDGYALVDKATGLARPAATLNGAQVQGKDSGLNDTQAKALLFGSRMQAAEQVLGKLDAQGVNRGSVVKSVAESTPLVGGALGALANSTIASPQQQQVEQAQRDFVNAVLRRESGAVISPSEFDSAKKQYFPQVGDSQAVIQQKAQNRQLATRGLMAEVPAKKRNSISAEAPAQQQGGASIDFQLPPDVQAILNKHGAK